MKEDPCQSEIDEVLAHHADPICEDCIYHLGKILLKAWKKAMTT
jgi:hypothetical protein